MSEAAFPKAEQILILGVEPFSCDDEASDGFSGGIEERVMNGLIYFRADHELIGRVIAEKLRRRTDRARIDDGFQVVGARDARGCLPRLA